jgi:hypothetical protein
MESLGRERYTVVLYCWANTALEHEYGSRFQAAAAIEKCELRNKKHDHRLINASAAYARRMSHHTNLGQETRIIISEYQVLHPNGNQVVK